MLLTYHRNTPKKKNTHESINVLAKEATTLIKYFIMPGFLSDQSYLSS